MKIMRAREPTMPSTTLIILPIIMRGSPQTVGSPRGQFRVTLSEVGGGTDPSGQGPSLPVQIVCVLACGIASVKPPIMRRLMSPVAWVYFIVNDILLLYPRPLQKCSE